jgi:hypothetical protein
VVNNALGHRQSTIATVDRAQHLALGVHRAPHPPGQTLPARDGFGRTHCMVLDCAEQGQEFIELPLSDLHGVQDISGKGLELRRRFA